MTCERLVCANCAGPVAEGRCPVCRSARQQLHRQGVPAPYLLAALAVLVIVLALVATRLGG